MSTGGRNDADELRTRFPNVQNSAEITSPITCLYNCIAYAAGDMTRWWWPDPLYIGFWPPNVKRIESLPAFQGAYETIGFQLCANGDFQSGTQKIAVFHLNATPTHAAKLIGPNIWSSKLGQWYDVSHTERCLDGNHHGGYGEIAFYMSRKA